MFLPVHHTVREVWFLSAGELPERIKWVSIWVVAMLALVEACRTALSYLAERRFKTTYLIETARVVLMTGFRWM